jgi:hypothetical protein
VTVDPVLDDLPLELRAAIDLIAAQCGGSSGMIRSRIVGVARLVAELKRYAPADETAASLIALGVTPAELRTTVVTTAPDQVLALVAGPLDRLLDPLRTAGAVRIPLPPDLPSRAWRALGYERVTTEGIQGIGSLIWVAGERGLRRAGRPDLADRCRIAGLRTLIAAQPSSLATVRLRRYRRTTLSDTDAAAPVVQAFETARSARSTPSPGVRA